jgi:hypothetical protein
MARDKTDKTDLTPVATPATRAAEKETKPVRSRGRYEFAVILARLAIRSAKERPRNGVSSADPERVMAGLLKRVGAGETLTADEAGALCAAMAAREALERRGRGRPKGRNLTAVEAFNAAAYATLLVPGLSDYENQQKKPGKKHDLTRCKALADAMKAEGFERFTTVDAAAKEMRTFKREGRDALRKIPLVLSRLKVTLQDVGQAWRRTVLDMQKPLERIRRDAQALGRAWGVLSKQIHALNRTTEKLEAIENNINSHSKSLDRN